MLGYTAEELVEIGLGDIPRSMGEALRFDDRERQVHSHGADRVGRGRVSATFHGHGGTKDTEERQEAREPGIPLPGFVPART